MLCCNRNFNPRSREGSDGCHERFNICHNNFNPRSREGSDTGCMFCGYGCHLISIHAPARGATRQAAEALDAQIISIHAPARGATMSRQRVLITVSIFQSTLPRGERPRATTNQRNARRISIHAPARGATCPEYRLRRSKRISIHAPARGATPLVAYDVAGRSNFNPRSREGSDEGP